MKPGHKSSEFWGGLIGAIIIPILVKFEIMDEQTAMASVGAIITYIVGRSWVKAKNGNGKK